MLPSRFFSLDKQPPTKKLKRTHSQQHINHQQEEELQLFNTSTNEERPPTKTRLAHFRSSSSVTPQQKKKTISSAHFQAKFAAKPSSAAVKWEQPQSVWEPGAEQSKSHQYPAHHHGPDTPNNHIDNDDKDKDSSNEEEDLGQNKKNQKNKLTQLEQQWAQFKKQYPHLIIFMEVGYKIRLFGADAILASQVLSIGHLAIPGRESTFFPKTSLYLHLSRMIMAGYKVGLFSQSETRSLRNVESGKCKKSRVFARHLTGVYSLSTWTETDPNRALPTAETEAAFVQHWILSLHASSPSSRHPQNDAKAQLSMVAICPQNGEIVWDVWSDDPIRSKLETRMTYFRPIEILVPLSGLDGPSEKLINWLIKDPSARSPVRPRLESTEQDYTPRSAYELVSSFCQPNKQKSRTLDRSSQEGHHPSQEEDSTEPEFLHHIVELPDGVLIALAGLIIHMKSYQLESIFRQSRQFKSFSSQSSMILDANTLKNLEIFENSSDRTERGSLFWVLDRTKTPMGKRLLKQWIGKPLVDIKLLTERADAIEELIGSQSHPVLIKMRRMLGMRLPDLEKSLVRIQYGKCTEKELLKFLEVMVELTATFGSASLVGTSKTSFRSSLLQDIFAGFAAVRDQAIEYRSELDAKAILKGEYENMFVNADELYPQLSDLKDCVSCIHAELAEHLQACRNILQNPKLEFITIGSEEMLIEVRLQHLDRVPENWMKFSSTRAVQRFRTPEAQRLLDERDKYQDLIGRTARGHFEGFLRAMEEAYDGLRGAIQKLALMDCLMSLARVATENRYCRPRIVPDPCIHLVAARHPTVEQILDKPLVPNDCSLNRNALSTIILTGNNMGGKSVTAKMIGCIVLMTQMGSYVPAERATIGLFDGCYTRMGMSEELGQGRSAFMVEMSETSNILRAATARSLVIIDELGYGTSTYDGLAIATAVLDHLVDRIRCFTIFITHYPQLNELAIKYPGTVKSYHMKFIDEGQMGSSKQSPENDDDNGGGRESGRIVFLYKMMVGLASKSHGIHVAQLAGLPGSVLETARLKSAALERSVERKKKSHRTSLVKDLVRGIASLSCSSSSATGCPVLPGRAELVRQPTTARLVSLAQLALLSLPSAAPHASPS